MRVTPSGLGRVMACPGSLAIEGAYAPAKKSVHQNDGLLAHSVSAARLLGREVASLATIPADMMVHTGGYVKSCQALIPFRGDGGHVEEKFKGPFFNGILDFWTYNPINRMLYIRDLKYGFSAVEVIGNWQLIAYAMLLIPQRTPDIVAINLGVYQPRGHHQAGPDRSWTITADQLEVYRAEVRAVIELIRSGRAGVVTGPHCRHCRGAIRCHGADIAAANAIDVAFEPIHTPPEPDQIALDLAVLRRASSLLNSKLKALEAHTIEVIRAGAIIPGWEIAQGRGGTTWKQGPQGVINSGVILGCNVSKPAAPVTPIQARDRGLISPEAFIVLSESTPGAWGLQKIDTNKIKEILNGK